MKPALTTLIQNADTFFVVSHNDRDDMRDTGGVDLSHRGGRPGFVKVDGNTLTVPDYIGNFGVNPKAGLLFIDFTTGDLIQMTGTVELMWTPDDDLRSFRGAERAWRFHLKQGHILKAVAPKRFEVGEPSPNSLLTGNWTEAAEQKQLDADRAAWRPFRVTRMVEERNVIRSTYLEPLDGRVLMPFKPGQYLTLRLP